MIKMPVSKLEKRKTRNDTNNDQSPESPKRPKIHAQRKFAQGCSYQQHNGANTLLNQMRAIEKERVRQNQPVTPTNLISTKPDVFDFINALVYRNDRTVLTPDKDFLNNANKKHKKTHENFFFRDADLLNSSETPPSTSKIQPEPIKTPFSNYINSIDKPSPSQPPDRPFVAFGVRKRVDPKYLPKYKKEVRILASKKKLVATRGRPRLKAKPIVKTSDKKTQNKRSTSSIIKRELANRKSVKIPPKIVKTKLKKKLDVRNSDRLKIQKSKLSDFSSGDEEPLAKARLNETKNMNKDVQNAKSLKTVNHVKNNRFFLNKRLTRSSKEFKKLNSVTVQLIRHSVIESKLKQKIKLISKSRKLKEQRNELSTNKRPTRKTKEAATLYMELLGRKLVQETELDDDNISIESYPELPNVRRAEQREIEIKQKVMNKLNCNESVKHKNIDKLEIESRRAQKKIDLKKSETKKSPEVKQKKIEKKELNKTNESVKVVKENFNDSDEEPLIKITRTTKKEETNKKEQVRNEKKIKTEKNDKKKSDSKKMKSNKNVVKATSSGDEAEFPGFSIKDETNSKLNDIKEHINVTNEKIKTSELYKLPLEKIKSNELIEKWLNDNDKEMKRKTIAKKQKKKRQIDETSQISKLRGHGKKELEKKIEKDLSKKVKSFETKINDDKKTNDKKTNDKKLNKKQIKENKEINDIKESNLKNDKNDDEINKVDEIIKENKNDNKKKTINEKIQNEEITVLINNLETKIDNQNDNKINKTNDETNETIQIERKENENKDERIIENKDDEKKSIKLEQTDQKQRVQQRRNIFTKTTSPQHCSSDIKTSVAFSPNNESSIYSFDAELEPEPLSPGNIPFRRNRKTNEGESKDENLKQFRIPAVLRHDEIKSSISEVSLALAADQPILKEGASFTVQVSSDGNATAKASNIQQASFSDDDDDMFYIPLQTKMTTPDQQLIQGIAVKLGTLENQQVIMQAKLVTKTPSVTTVSSTSKIASTKNIILPQRVTSLSDLNITSPMSPPVGTVQSFRSINSEESVSTKSISSNSSNASTIRTNKRQGRQKLTEHKLLKSQTSSPSCSSDESNKKPESAQTNEVDPIFNPIITNQFPSISDLQAKIVEAPLFHPREKEFQDPLEYIEKIRTRAEPFGICRIVPPAGFKPECKVNDEMRFTAYNQYVHKMLHRWGPNFQELTAIKKYLATQNISLTQTPWIGGMEIDLPRLYQTVQSLGGLKEVIEKKKWTKVAEIMRIPKSAQDRITKLDDIYCKYLLPYDTLSQQEREKLFEDVNRDWEKLQEKLIQNQAKDDFKNSDNESEKSNEESDNQDEEDDLTECIVRGRSMPLSSFYRIARNTMSMWFETANPSVNQVETEFWKHVEKRTHHICVNSGSIDSGSYGYGFSCTKTSPFARHPWNLKVLTNNNGSILRSLGPIMGVTVPTLHVGMVFSACCWYRDPHGLPWIEYLHTGANKVWYGIPDAFNERFRNTLQRIVPNLCRKTSIWLPSDTAMVPPNLLVENNISLCRTVQEPGQFIVIFPKAFTSSLCTGYTVSESVFFAQSSWLNSAEKIFAELKESNEPSVFALERLLLSMAKDPKCHVDILKKILPDVIRVRSVELQNREKLKELGMDITGEYLPQSNHKNKRKADTDGEYLCEICKSNLYVSLVANTTDDEVYCLAHAIELLSEKKVQLDDIKLMYMYSNDDLNNLIDSLNHSIDVKSQKKLK